MLTVRIRYTLSKQHRNIRKATNADREKILDRRLKLEKRILAFMKLGNKLFPSVNLIEEVLTAKVQGSRFTVDIVEDDLDFGSDTEMEREQGDGYLEDQAEEARDEEVPHGDEEPWIDEDTPVQDGQNATNMKTVEATLKATDGSVECFQLPLPSSLGRQRCRVLGLIPLLEHEVALRKGGANDALEDLRISLAHKAAIFRTELRHAKATQGKSRAWDNVKGAERKVSIITVISWHAVIDPLKIRVNVQNYMVAYRALQMLLPKSDPILNQFKPIVEADLRMSSDITEEKRYNQKNDRLAWFWHIRQGGRETSHSWMRECQRFNPPSSLLARF